MAAGVLRHLKSLRAVRRDGGWIRTLLADAENERMVSALSATFIPAAVANRRQNQHLMTFLKVGTALSRLL